jgi:hypothetical protein
VSWRIDPVVNVLKAYGIYEGLLYRAEHSVYILDARGRIVCSEYDLINGLKALRPYIESVELFEGKLRVCL